jgi:cytosine/adenosine deaminase-related metal-dependent hydrolase
MSRTVIRGGCLLTPDGLIQDAGVIVSGGRIEQVEPNAALAVQPDDTVIDAPDRLIAPGFVNAHTHLYGVLSHGITVEALVSEFSSFLEDFWWPYMENRIDHDRVRRPPPTGWRSSSTAA